MRTRLSRRGNTSTSKFSIWKERGWGLGQARVYSVWGADGVGEPGIRDQSRPGVRGLASPDLRISGSLHGDTQMLGSGVGCLPWLVPAAVAAVCSPLPIYPSRPSGGQRWGGTLSSNPEWRNWMIQTQGPDVPSGDGKPDSSSGLTMSISGHYPSTSADYNGTFLSRYLSAISRGTREMEATVR